MRRRLWPILLAAGIGLVILLSLGVWQVQRLQWKEDLIAQLTANMKAPALSLQVAEGRVAAGENMEFMPVSATGRFRHSSEMHVISTYEGGPGWVIVTPLVTVEGAVVLVDRGSVPDGAFDRLERPDGEVAVTGLLRQGNRKRGYFDPDNDASGNRWYWWDVPAMLAAAGLQPGERPVSFVLQTVPIGTVTSFPRPQPPQLGLRNNHLGYAITWFGLAATLVAMTVAFVLRLRRDAANGRS